MLEYKNKNRKESLIMVANETNQTKNVTGKRVAAIGRWMPIHYGHKRFLIKLAKNPEFEKVVVMIGSCF